jgi:hypothetical protein
MLADSFLEGLKWGLFAVGVIIPCLGLAAGLYFLQRWVRRRKLFVPKPDFEELAAALELDEDEGVEEEERHRFIPSTVVRPPPIIKKRDSENGD